MIRALTTAATGLEAQQANIERISNDIANVNTDGYKKTRNEFQDLMYDTTKEAGAQLGASSQTPVGIQTGLGVKVGASHKLFQQGSAKMTGHAYDLMINGRGFFPVQTPNGEILYSRVGNFHRDAQGRVMTGSGALVIPQITVPAEAVDLKISPNGEVRAEFQNGTDAQLGQLQLVNFANEQGLTAVGTSLYRPSQGSGQPIQGVPGENGLGVIQQGALEGSNVDIATSMIDMISTQRAYEMNTKVMGAADQMWGYTTGIK